MERRLYRSRRHRMFLGVCGGIADYFRVDPVLVRIFAVLITIVSSFGPGIIAYFILALIIPLEGSRSANSQDTLKENLADLEQSSRNLGKQFKHKSGDTQSPPAPTPEPADSGISFPPPTRSNRGLYILAIALVAVGVFFIIVKSMGWLWQFLLPLTLIIAGVIIIFLVLSRQRPS